ncbi:MAG: phosphoenolpyruvate synthase [Caldilineaceae bacterium]|nr:phosphoenolpyruvate synthase [Caldilineaceae bacterium]
MDHAADAALVLSFNDARADLAHAGGKGANLARMYQAGLPVPTGFVIATAAYRAYAQANNLAAVIERAMAGLDPHDGDGNQADDLSLQVLERAAGVIRTAFAAGRMSQALPGAILSAYGDLGRPAVAVRSSATAEDLPELSFAGQQDTYLNIIGDDALLRAVVGCWSSLWTARAIGYRLRNRIDHEDVALAVVIQRLVPAEAAGVMFTANPLNGRRTETVIDATLGLGEALVAGQVEPDHYVIDGTTGRVLSRRMGSKALSIRPQEGGGTVQITEQAHTRSALPDSALADLVRLGARVAQLYQAPQDIEWAYAEGRIYLLQARPITSLFPVPEGAAADPLDVYFSFGAVQGLFDPITPLGRDALAGFMAGGARLLVDPTATIETQQVAFNAAERIWARCTPLLRNKLGRIFVSHFVPVIEPGIAQAFAQVIRNPRMGKGGLPSPRTVLSLARLLVPVWGKLAAALVHPERSRGMAERAAETYLATIAARRQRARTLAEQIDLFEEAFIGAMAVIVKQYGPRIGAGLASMNRLLAMAEHYLPALDGRLALVRGLPHNVTTEMDLVLWATAQQIGTGAGARQALLAADSRTLADQYLNGELPPVAQRAIAAFLARYGVRGLAEIDLGRPRWREDPAQIMQILQSYLRIEDENLAPDAVFARGEQVAAATLAELQAAVRRTPLGAAKARLVGWVAARMRALAGLRESPKFLMIRIMGIIREMLLETGAELVRGGQLVRRDDLFYLHLNELRALAAGYAIDWQALVAQRRASYARERLRRQLPRVLLSDGQVLYEGTAARPGLGDGAIVGSPVSPGVVEGVVRVVHDPHQANLHPGEILVCPGTDPSWTPLFLAAGGLVTEVGGLMTHGSVVAREYGIPAVVGVHQVTQRLRTGQRVRVDGTRGEIVVVED